MFYDSPGLFQKRPGRITLLLGGALVCIGLATVSAHAQRKTAAAEADVQPAFTDFKGVRIGMPTEDARKKLGTPRDKGSDQDFYVFNDTQAVQVFYAAGAVTAISIDYMDGATGIPAAKDILGTEADSRTDGSLYKLVRYPKAGYWVSYSRTAGNTPTTTITMQKIGN